MYTTIGGGTQAVVMSNGYFLIPWKSSALYCSNLSKWWGFVSNVSAYRIKGAKVKLSNFMQHTRSLSTPSVPNLSINASSVTYKSLISSAAQLGAYYANDLTSGGAQQAAIVPSTHAHVQNIMQSAQSQLKPYSIGATQIGMATLPGNPNGENSAMVTANEGATAVVSFNEWDGYAKTQVNAPAHTELKVEFPVRNKYPGMMRMGHSNIFGINTAQGTNEFGEAAPYPKRFQLPVLDKDTKNRMMMQTGMIQDFTSSESQTSFINNVHTDICPQNGAPPSFFAYTVG